MMKCAGKIEANSLKDNGHEVEFFQVDVANRESVDRMVEKVTAQFGKIDILINNAGITRDACWQK